MELTVTLDLWEDNRTECWIKYQLWSIKPSSATMNMHMNIDQGKMKSKQEKINAKQGKRNTKQGKMNMETLNLWENYLKSDL